MSLDSYNKLRVIGKGSYGEVWLVKHKKDRKQYVLKKLDLHNASKRERTAAEQEAKLLSKLKHPNIVGYKDSFETESGFLYIAMGYCEGGDLYNRLKEQKMVPLEEPQVVEWFVQITMALQYMHERNILHRDLKTQNIFLTKSKIIKVGDLGIARVLDSSCDMATTLIGTPYYMSPELFSNKPYNHKSDVWALGCCVYEMTTLKHAFNAKDMNSLVYKILKGRTPQMPKQYSTELVTLIKAMLNYNPDKRPGVGRILREPYIKKNIASFLDGTKKRRPSTGGGSRPGTAESRRSSQSDEKQANVAKPSVLVEPPSQKSKKAPDRIVNLEPLNIAPELDIIKEELDSSQEAARITVKSMSSSGDGSENGARQESSAPAPGRKKGLLKNLQRRKNNAQKSDPVIPKPVEISVEDLTSSDVGAGTDKRHVHKSQSDSQLSSHNNARCDETDGKRELNHSSDYKSSSSSEKLATPLPHLKHIKSESAVQDLIKVEKKTGSSPRSRRKKSESSLSARRSDDQSNGDHAKPALIKPKKTDHVRPLPGAPKSSLNVPTKSKSSCPSDTGYSSSQSIPEDTPRGLNQSARARRREKIETETPRTARSVDIDRGRRSLDQAPMPSSRRSDDYAYMRSEKKAVEITNASEQRRRDNSERTPSSQSKESPTPRRQLPSPPQQNSMDDSSSDSSEEVEEQQKEKKRNDREMNNFISLLDTTLRMQKPDDEDEVEMLEADDIIIPLKDNKKIKVNLAGGATYTKYRPPAPRPPRPSDPVTAVNDRLSEHAPNPGASLSTTGRLWERITQLRKDCIRGLGVQKLKQAYDILDGFEQDEVEPQLISLLGRDQFDEFVGKIWQLKFCEESAFGLV